MCISEVSSNNAKKFMLFGMLFFMIFFTGFSLYYTVTFDNTSKQFLGAIVFIICLGCCFLIVYIIHQLNVAEEHEILTDLEANPFEDFSLSNAYNIFG